MLTAATLPPPSMKQWEIHRGTTLSASFSSSEDEHKSVSPIQQKQRYGVDHHLLIPTCLLGGTAVAYSQLFSRSLNSSLSPIAALYMLLLSIQYAILPKLSKTFIRKSSSKVQSALTEEVAKSALAFSLFLTCNTADNIRIKLTQWSFSGSLAMAGIPAFLYAIQGVLQYHSHQFLDPVTFNGLQQTKTLSAALCCFLLLNKRQSVLQVCALFILVWSSLLFQTSSNTSTSSSKTKNEGSIRFWQGVIPCLLATLMSGLAGALSQHGLQRQQYTNISPFAVTDPFFYALEVSMFSAVTLVVMPYIQRLFAPNVRTKDSTDTSTSDKAQRAIGENDWWILIPTVCKAAGGILTVLVHQHSGTVSKGFALTFGLVLSACFESALTGKSMAISQVVGTVMVVAASYLHQMT